MLLWIRSQVKQSRRQCWCCDWLWTGCLGPFWDLWKWLFVHQWEQKGRLRVHLPWPAQTGLLEWKSACCCLPSVNKATWQITGDAVVWTGGECLICSTWSTWILTLALIRDSGVLEVSLGAQMQIFPAVCTLHFDGVPLFGQNFQTLDGQNTVLGCLQGLCIQQLRIIQQRFNGISAKIPRNLTKKLLMYTHTCCNTLSFWSATWCNTAPSYNSLASTIYTLWSRKLLRQSQLTFQTFHWIRKQLHATVNLMLCSAFVHKLHAWCLPANGHCLYHKCRPTRCCSLASPNLHHHSILLLLLTSDPKDHHVIYQGWMPGCVGKHEAKSK